MWLKFELINENVTIEFGKYEKKMFNQQVIHYSHKTISTQKIRLKKTNK